MSKEPKLTPSPSPVDHYSYLNNWDGSYIKFRMSFPFPGKKTKVWEVLGSDNSLIGIVKWYSAWRKYCFFSLNDVILEEICLQEIAQFIKDRTSDHKNGM